MSPAEKEFIKLGWKLLEAKCAYYIFDRPIMEDKDYDAMERRYDALAKKLGVPTTAVDMVGFDERRPCCKIVLHKMRGGTLDVSRKESPPLPRKADDQIGKKDAQDG